MHLCSKAMVKNYTGLVKFYPDWVLFQHGYPWKPSFHLPDEYEASVPNSGKIQNEQWLKKYPHWVKVLLKEFFESNRLFQPYMGKRVSYPTNEQTAYPFWVILKELLHDDFTEILYKWNVYWLNSMRL